MNTDVNYNDMKLFSLGQIKNVIELINNDLSEGDFPDDIRQFAFDKLIEKLQKES